jgi:hypothetical protein
LHESAKAADARPEASKELANCSRGALDTAAVLRGFLERVEVSGLRLAGFFLLLTGWAIALSAMVLLAAPLLQFAFVALGMAIEILGFAFVARTHFVLRGDRLD